ncbi:hypothetical protein [Nocardioides convexus]|uniref:hypothetical protein n=1 Tax=Nocardioides convexus TaxID=2712224 RepID=UPI0024187CE4|nr:hypothetical protein [Nocardioides convexus]
MRLDEEMVYESRVGDVFALGATSLADRGHHPRPGHRHPRAGRAWPAAVLEGRHRRAPDRARGGDRRVHPRARCAPGQEGRGPGPRDRARHQCREQPGDLPARAGRVHPGPAQ